MRFKATLGASLVAMAVASSANAQSFTWFPGTDFEYRNDSNGGALPVAAIGEFEYGAMFSVFLHASSFFIVDVPSNEGNVSPNSEIAQYGIVGSPTIAAVPAQNSFSTSVVQAEEYYYNGTNYLVSRVGKWNENAGTSSQAYGGVTWNANSYIYDTGAQPNLAIGGGSYNQVVEIHTAGTGAVGPLYARTGTFTADSVQWTSSSSAYDQGENPAVAIVPGFGLVVEVHQKQDGEGPLMFRTATLSASGQLNWSAAQQYDHGIYPKIAIWVPPANPFFPIKVIEVHQGQAAAGPLWMHIGTLNRDGTIVWGNNVSYTTGAHPSIATEYVPNAAESFGVEVHQGGANAGALWGHYFTLQ